MNEIWLTICVVLIGLSGGIAIGSGSVAFLVVLDVIPRLAQLTRSYSKVHWFEGAIIAGSMYWTFADFYGWHLRLFTVSVVLIGLLTGIFVGMLAAALTEVLNVLPILAKRLRIVRYLKWLLLAMVLGKISGSLFDWLIYQ